jgi:hypothetical protein
MGEIDKHFMESLERELGDQKREGQWHKKVAWVVVIAALVGGGAFGAWTLLKDPNAGRALPPELPPPSAQAAVSMSHKAKETGKTYYEEHEEIQSALADYARRIATKTLDLAALGPSFQPVSNFSWEKWYYDTVPVKEGFKTHKDAQPTPHHYTEDHAIITYTITDDDKWGAWGVGIKYAAALGIDITNPQNKEIASLIAAYVWLQSDSRLLYEKDNYFDEQGNFDPKKYKKDINLLRAGDEIRWPHLSEAAVRELGQAPQKYLEGTAPSVAPIPQAPQAAPAVPPNT